MTPERTYIDYLRDMLEACDHVAAFVASMTFDEFVQDIKTQFAVIRRWKSLAKQPNDFRNLSGTVSRTSLGAQWLACVINSPITTSASIWKWCGKRRRKIF
jgi:hypothetical protein